MSFFLSLLSLLVFSNALGDDLQVGGSHGEAYRISSEALPRQRISLEDAEGKTFSSATPLLGKIVAAVSYPFDTGFIGVTDSSNAYWIRWDARKNRFTHQAILISTTERGKEKFKELKPVDGKIFFNTLSGKTGWIEKKIQLAGFYRFDPSAAPISVAKPFSVFSRLSDGRVLELKTDPLWKNPEWVERKNGGNSKTDDLPSGSRVFSFHSGTQVRLGQGTKAWVKLAGQSEWTDLSSATQTLTQLLISPPDRKYQSASFDQKGNLYLIYPNTRPQSRRSTLDADIIPAAFLSPLQNPGEKAKIRSTADLYQAGSFDSVIRIVGNPFGEGIVFLTVDRTLYLLEPVSTFNPSPRSPASDTASHIALPIIDENVKDFFVASGRLYYVRTDGHQAIGAMPTSERGIFSIESTEALPLPKGWVGFLSPEDPEYPR